MRRLLAVQTLPVIEQFPLTNRSPFHHHAKARRWKLPRSNVTGSMPISASAPP